MKRLVVSLTVIAALLSGFTGCSEKEEDSALKAITVSANGSSTMLKPTETLPLEVLFFPETTTDRDVEWSSSDDDIATVANGTVTAKSEGSVTITAKSKNNPSIYDELSVTVLPPDIVILEKSGSVEGVWAKNSIVIVNEQIRVDNGKSLTVEEGVTIIIQSGQNNSSGAPIEFFVEGSLYLKGSKENPVLVTVPEGERTWENRYEGLWGGIVGGPNFQELLFDNVIVEYTGAVTRTGSPSVAAGMSEADKDRTAQILTDNPLGKIVIINSTFRYAESDMMYIMGGKAIVYNNIIHTIGATDNDGINIKAGVEIDIAYNLFFAVNSNAMKLNSKGESPERSQAIARAYNNTIVNSGWRRVKNLKGGSIFVQQNVLATVYNNLILNSKLMTKTPDLDNPTPNDGAAWGTIVDYNFYASGSQTLTVSNLMNIGGVNILTAFDGYTHNDPEYWHDWDNYPTKYGADFPLIDKNSLVASAPGAPNLSFVNFGFNTVALHEDKYETSWDFHVQAGSPVLAGADGKTPRSDFSGSFAPYFGTTGLTVGGETYKTPAPSARYGAFGTK